MSPIREDQLRDELRHDPNTPLDPHALAAGIAGKGRRIRRRRQIIGAVGGVAAATLAVVIGVNALQMGSPEALTPGTPETAVTRDGLATATAPVQTPAVTPVEDSVTEIVTEAPTQEPTPVETAAGTEAPAVEMPALPYEGLTPAEIEAKTGSYGGETPYGPAEFPIDKDFQPCHFGPENQPLDTPVVQSKAIEQSAGSGTRAQGLIVFADPAHAAAAMIEFRERLLLCDGATEHIGSARTDLGGDHDAMLATVYTAGGHGFTGYYAISQIGRSIAWSSDFGDGGSVDGTVPGISPAVEAGLWAPIEELTPTLERMYVN